MLTQHRDGASQTEIANAELSLMNSKLQGLEKELEQERRKLRDMQESARERDKEYHKLKVCRPPYMRSPTSQCYSPISI
jgi:hypothetical protein